MLWFKNKYRNAFKGADQIGTLCNMGNDKEAGRIYN